MISTQQICMPENGTEMDIDFLMSQFERVVFSSSFVAAIGGSFIGIIIDAQCFGGTSKIEFSRDWKAIPRILILTTSLALFLTEAIVNRIWKPEKVSPTTWHFIWTYIFIAYLPKFLYCLLIFGFSRKLFSWMRLTDSRTRLNNIFDLEYRVSLTNSSESHIRDTANEKMEKKLHKWVTC